MIVVITSYYVFITFILRRCNIVGVVNKYTVNIFSLPQVEGIQEFSGELKGEYAGDKLVEILQKEDEVVDAWKALLKRVTERSSKLGQSDEYQRLIIMIQNLLLWIEDMRLQIQSDEIPRYVEHMMCDFQLLQFTIYSYTVNRG